MISSAMLSSTATMRPEHGGDHEVAAGAARESCQGANRVRTFDGDAVQAPAEGGRVGDEKQQQRQDQHDHGEYAAQARQHPAHGADHRAEACGAGRRLDLRGPDAEAGEHLLHRRDQGIELGRVLRQDRRQLPDRDQQDDDERDEAGIDHQDEGQRGDPSRPSPLSQPPLHRVRGYDDHERQERGTDQPGGGPDAGDGDHGPGRTEQQHQAPRHAAGRSRRPGRPARRRGLRDGGQVLLGERGIR